MSVLITCHVTRYMQCSLAQLIPMLSKVLLDSLFYACRPSLEKHDPTVRVVSKVCDLCLVALPSIQLFFGHHYSNVAINGRSYTMNGVAYMMWGRASWQSSYTLSDVAVEFSVPSDYALCGYGFAVLGE